MSTIGVVAIGRNEGERLRRCLGSVHDRGYVLVYVDSGSTDGSVELARSMGVEVVDLDLSRPFSAARARNEGLDRLRAIAPGIRYVQFVDGDCEVGPGWIDRAARELDEHPDLAVVAGRCRERHPEQSVYNRLADLEWNTPIGDAKSCGGNAFMRVEAFRQVGGFNPEVIAGEEPELCVRLRQAGWKIRRIDAEMVQHDMAMTRFQQWWKRAVRGGHAFAEGCSLHGGPPERHYAREVRSVVVWGILVPVLAIGLAWPTRGLSLALLAGYALLFAKVYRYHRSVRGWSAADARLYSSWVLLSLFPLAQGVLRFGIGQISGKRSRVIDHRGPVSAEPRTA